MVLGERTGAPSNANLVSSMRGPAAALIGGINVQGLAKFRPIASLGAQPLTRRLGTRKKSCGCRIEPGQNWRIHFSRVGVTEVGHLLIGYLRPSLP
jgi:hypothetical protein